MKNSNSACVEELSEGWFFERDIKIKIDTMMKS